MRRQRNRKTWRDQTLVVVIQFYCFPLFNKQGNHLNMLRFKVRKELRSKDLENRI